MSLLMRASTIIGRPVVTLGGDVVADVKDVVFDDDEARVVGFTLNNRGFLAGPAKESLPWTGVHALGPDALMIADERALEPRRQVLAGSTAGGGNVMGSRVITDDGTDLGHVTDAVIDVDDEADVVGYELEGSDALASRKGRTLFIPIPDTLSVSGEALIVPASAARYVRDDLAGFGDAVEDFREQLHEGRQ